MLKDLESHRRHANTFFLAVLWLHVPLNLAVGLAIGSSWLLLTLASVGVAALATATWRFASNQQAVRCTMAAAYMVMISLLLGAMRSNPWQLDVHMYYFAALALIAIYCDWRAIVVGTATVAVHHLVLNFVLPNLIFPGGTDLYRVVLHAVILSGEAAGLIWLSQKLVSMFEIANRNSQAALVARTAAEAATRETQDARESEARTAASRQAQDRKLGEEQRFVVDTLATSLERLAANDLSLHLDRAFAPAYENLRANFNAATEKLRDAMGLVIETASVIRSSADEVSTSSDELARRTETQAASLEEATASLAEITEAIRRNAEGAKHTQKIVSGAKTDAEKSGEVVRQAIQAMSGIEKSSKQIGQIIGVIDEIAFQTNLLALNAGVEAARAGDAGRGFAVVASEVRALAQRSAEAAKEIKTLVSESTAQVDQGVDLVAQTGVVLERICGQVAEINAAIVAIAAGSQEQSAGLQQVHAAVNQMDQITQQNAALMQDSTLAIHHLLGKSEELSQQMAQFNIGTNVVQAKSGDGIRVSGAPRPARAAVGR
jgi:methyl-accepting chemotaxis protein